ncbi:hypothetical protein [Burkholderia sp. RS02]|uniref:hypothetical protein n=1 Tax=unclassified Burkholderia TaxID=2613784 RepID=UPI0032186E7A
MTVIAGGAVHRLFSDQYEYQDFTDGKGACNRRTENAPYETEIMLTELATIPERRHLIETVFLWFGDRLELSDQQTIDTAFRHPGQNLALSTNNEKEQRDAVQALTTTTEISSWPTR